MEGGKRMKTLLWYAERFIKYYILRTEYRKVYRSFSNYCEQRRKYEIKSK